MKQNYLSWVMAALLAGLALPSLGADGTLDPTFGTGGKLTTAVGTGHDGGYAMVIQPDGKIIVAGRSEKGPGLNFYNSSVVRYTAAGALDGGFNGSGKLTFNFGGADDQVRALLLQPDGKIVLAGVAEVSGLGFDFGVTRLNSDGSPDDTFGTFGLTPLDFGIRPSQANGVAIQPDGRIVIVGTATPDGTDIDFGVARLGTDGVPDSAFNNIGITTTAIAGSGGYDQANAVVVQPDGRIVVAGYSHLGANDDFAIVRYLDNADPDTSFGSGGIVTTAFGTGDDQASCMTLQLDGKIIVGGIANISGVNCFALARYNVNGTLDSSFGSGGKTTTLIGTGGGIRSIVLDTAGRIVAAGTATIGGSPDFVVARYLPNGTLDTTFGTGGIASTSFGSGSDGDDARGVGIQPDGRIVVAGFTGAANRDFALARFDTELATAPQRPGIVAWYRGEGNATDAVGANNGTVLNGITFIPGQVGFAMNLDGTDDYVSIPDAPALRPASALTLEGWFRFGANTGTRVLVAKTFGTGFEDSYALWFEDGSLNGWATGNSFLQHGWLPNIGQWYHLAYTFDITAGEQSLYIDGVLVEQSGVSTPLTYDANPVLLGADLNAGTVDSFFMGQMDEVAIYNRALSAAEIKNVYDSGASGKSPPNLSFAWNSTGNFTDQTRWTPAGIPSRHDSITVNGGTLTVNANLTVSNLTLAATIAGSGNLTIRKNATWHSGTIQGSGLTVIPAGGLLYLDTSGDKTLTSHTINNSGTITWAGGRIIGNTIPTINNLAGALFDMQSDDSIDKFNGGVLINNFGTLRKSAGNGTKTLDLAGAGINNMGTWEVQTGALSISGAVSQSGTVSLTTGTGLTFGDTSTNSGTFNLTTNSTLNFANRIHVLSGATLNGPGFVRLASGTNIVTGLATADYYELSGGLLDGTGTLNVRKTLNWTSGTMQGTGATAIPAGGTFNISSGAIKTLLARTVNNSGTIAWSAGQITANTRPTINNLAGGVFDLQSDDFFAQFNGGAVINNSGTWRKSNGTGASTMDYATGQLNNNASGVLDIQKGSLFLNGPTVNAGSVTVNTNAFVWFGDSSTNSGSFTIGTNGSVYFATGNHALINGTTVSGLGFMRVPTGTLNINTPVSAGYFELGGGTLDGLSTLTVTNILSWTNGTMKGAGATTIPAGSALNLTGTSGKTLQSRTLNNSGTVTWSGGTLTGNAGPVINNLAGALFDMQTDDSLLRVGTALAFNNAGTLRKSAGTGAKSVDFTLSNTGTLDLKSGVLSIVGAYTASSSGLHRFSIGGNTAGTQFAQLQVGGAMTFNGTLDLALVNGFTPALGAPFRLVTSASRSGTFTTLTGRAITGGLYFSPNYLGTGLSMTVIDGTSGFDSSLLSLSGGQFHLRLQGSAGEFYRVEFSTNLPNWHPLSTNAISTGGTLDFTDTASTASPYRFYRAVFLP